MTKDLSMVVIRILKSQVASYPREVVFAGSDKALNFTEKGAYLIGFPDGFDLENYEPETQAPGIKISSGGLCVSGEAAPPPLTECEHLARELFVRGLTAQKSFEKANDWLAERDRQRKERA